MKIQQAIFLQSNTDYKKCPKPDKAEYAFIGRSNVGKSSLINALVLKKDLAKTSQTPGKTRLINHFLINEAWYLVDKMIHEYLQNRDNLIATFVLIDVRHEPQKVDLEFMRKLGEKDIPFYIIFTKSDKLSKSVVAQNVANYETKMLEIWDEMPHYIITSSVRRQGREEILALIDEMNQGVKTHGF